ncbi:uncharacterized protein PG998_008811 [Apiospora kogelbergensis]|uniref:uncharacterized protein n=1 Tax=Apiospora kogelbergensis TaxID=1337665 RepID=UPI00312FB369
MASNTRSPKATFGVEWEFYIGLYQLHSANQKPDAVLAAFPNAVIIPHLRHGIKEVQIYARQGIIAALRDSGVDINDVDENGKITSPPGPSSQRYQNNTAERKYFLWSLDTDASLKAPRLGGQDVPAGNPTLSWLGLELVSPAVTDEASSYADLERVINLVKAKYYVNANLTCGLHVHTALGINPVPLRGLRRCAALCFAMDSVVAELHPRHRLKTAFANPVRTASNAAMGRTAVDASEHYAESPHNQYKWFIKLDPPPDVDIRGVVHQILRCTGAGPVAWMMATSFLAANYNFSQFGNPDVANPTLEFRQHEGTADTTRISAWARFCAGLFRYAVLELTDEKLAEVVALCEDAEKDKSGRLYLYELLELLGMTDQARGLGLQPYFSN